MTYKALVKIIKNAINSKGQSMTEYILVLGLIALAVIALWPPLAESLIDRFTEFTAKVSSS